MSRKKKGRWIAWISGLLMVCGLGILGYQRWGDYNLFLNLDVVEHGLLLRSGQPDIGDIKRIHEEYKLGTIFCVSGREDKYVQRYAEAQGIKVLSISIPPGGVPTEEEVELWFDLMEGKTIKLKNYSDMLTEWPDDDTRRIKFPFPVLVHCKAGSDRAGVLVALYRIHFQGWSTHEAKREMLKHFHIPLFNPNPYKFLDQYQEQNQG
jgi:protein-tyrosine phosphatase